MKAEGLDWEPCVGHYVFDRGRVCRRNSPFQSRVYYILDYDCFLRHVGGEAVFRRGMVWLPTWSDIRILLRDRGVADREVASIAADGILEGNELTRLYRKALDVTKVQARQ